MSILYRKLHFVPAGRFSENMSKDEKKAYKRAIKNREFDELRVNRFTKKSPYPQTFEGESQHVPTPTIRS